MKNAIQKAIKGGYPWKGVMEGGKEYNCHYKTLLDPLFWQALGKAEGWGDRDSAWCAYNAYFCGGKVWKYNMHRFIDHIAEGKDIDSFFNELLK